MFKRSVCIQFVPCVGIDIKDVFFYAMLNYHIETHILVNMLTNEEEHSCYISFVINKFKV